MAKKQTAGRDRLGDLAPKFAQSMEAGKSRVYNEPFCQDVWYGIYWYGNDYK